MSFNGHTTLLFAENRSETVSAKSGVIRVLYVDDDSDAVFLVDYAQHLAAALRRAGLRFQTMRHGIGMLLNVFFKK